MIFVILGTQDKSFFRLVSTIDKAVQEGKIKEKVIVQAGCTKYKSDFIEIKDYIPIKQFEKYIKEASFIITHAGAGSIINAMSFHKKIIAIARLKEYKEHVNNHQVQILDRLSKQGYILKLENENDLVTTIENLKNFIPKEYKWNNNHFVNELDKVIDNLIKKRRS